MLEIIVEKNRRAMDEVKANLASALQKIHSGRATPLLIEDVKVDYYNQKLPLKQLATIAVADPSTLSVTAWDKGALVNIEAAIRQATLNLNPRNDGSVIRISLPPLTSERREEMIKLVTQLAEGAKVALRQVRDQSWRDIKQLVKAGKLTEDDRYRGEELLNKTIATYNDELMALAKGKEESLSQ